MREKKPYKFKELKVYSSTEWLANNKKKYRQVFDRYEVSYIYAELSFYNKFFDDSDWDVSIQLRCYALQNSKRRELCNLTLNKKVSRYDNIVYIREGWGNKNEGSFWKKGTYYWEAWIEGKKEASRYFYIEDTGEQLTAENNPYLDIFSLKLYEGPYDDVPEEERIYFSTFSAEKTRYIYGELVFVNNCPEQKWHCELFAKFYNESKELKGEVIRLQTIRKNEEVVSISVGWGSNVRSWKSGKYTLELMFMGHLLAVIPFEVGEEHIEGIPGVLLPNKRYPVVLSPTDDLSETFEEVMYNLDSMIGLNEIKQRVKDHAKYIQFVQLRRDKGFREDEEINIHSAFIGNPGTGKTTVAGMMGKIYRKMGLLSSGHVHEVDRVDLVGEYIGQTAPKVKEAIQKARGGVLFIDEAYALARTNDDTKDFGREVIEILMKEMSNGEGDLAIIVAGYPKEMMHFLNSNPGLKSRFKHVYQFADYFPQELSQIADYACEQKSVRLTEPAKERIDEIIVEAFRKRDKTFGNARFIFDLVEKSKINLGLRIMESEDPTQFDQETLETVLLEDVNKVEILPPKLLPRIPVDEKLLETSLEELDALIGMRKIKEEIHSLVDLVQYYRREGKSVLNKFHLHTVFVGNPGTGKTTVARILAKIYKALGILERGHLVETDRQGLVAGYIGQSAIKTTERIDEAMGGVLFIDEAYSLTTRSGIGDYGNEVIQTILKRMEDNRGEFFVFAAGYPDNMEAFLKANPGLRSRFDKILHFEDYSAQDLWDIAGKMVAENGFYFDQEASAAMKNYFVSLFDKRDRYFGNARQIRTIVDRSIKNQNLRLASLNQEELAREDVNALLLKDVASFEQNQDELVFNKNRIGFRSSDR